MPFRVVVARVVLGVSTKSRLWRIGSLREAPFSSSLTFIVRLYSSAHLLTSSALTSESDESENAPISRFEQTLLRLGEVPLQKFVGSETTSLLGKLGDRTVATSQLARLLARRRATELLSDPSSRNEILEALPRSEAEALAAEIGVQGGGNPWQVLLGRVYRRGSEERERLFAFFEIPLAAEADTATRPSSVVSIEPLYPLFAYQHCAVEETLAFLRGQTPRVLIHMPTGSGKTRTAMHAVAGIIRDIGPEDVVLWLAHSEELCEQAAEEFARAWRPLGNRSVSLARFYGPFETNLGEVRNAFLVASLGKLYQRSGSDQSSVLQLKERLRLIVFDEAHKAGAASYKHIMDILAPAHGPVGVVGLSATPGRTRLDIGEDEALANFFARQKVTIRIAGYTNPIAFLQAEGYLAVPEYVLIRYDPKIPISPKQLADLKTGFDLDAATLNALARDGGRNTLVLNAAIGEASAGRKMIIFACSVEHASLLANVLTLKGYRCAALSANTPRVERQRIVEDFRCADQGSLQIITNYGVLSTGFDAPNAEVAIIARPTQSVVLYSQMVGRVIRGPRSGGSPTCRVVTVVDQLPGFRDIAEGFSHWEDVW